MQVLGHRGSPGFPRFGENTRSSFRKALAEGAAGFELDVRRCADRTIVVIHDATMDRTTNGRGRVSDLSYEQLSRFDAGRGDPIPRLIDVLDEFGAICAIHIELKEAGLADDIASMAADRGIQSNIVVSAFDEDDNDEDARSNWLELSLIHSRIPTALLAGETKLQRTGSAPFIEAARRLGARGVHPSKDAIRPALVEMAHQAGLAVRAWTVNVPEDAVRLNDMAVDAIFSDCPGVCLKALEQ